MAAWGCEFYLLVLKVSLTRERYFQHSKIKFVSPSGHVLSSVFVWKYSVEWLSWNGYAEERGVSKTWVLVGVCLNFFLLKNDVLGLALGLGLTLILTRTWTRTHWHSEESRNCKLKLHSKGFYQQILGAVPVFKLDFPHISSLQFLPGNFSKQREKKYRPMYRKF